MAMPGKADLFDGGSSRTPTSSFGEDQALDRLVSKKVLSQNYSTSSSDEKPRLSNKDGLEENWVLVSEDLDEARTRRALIRKPSLLGRSEDAPYSTASHWTPMSLTTSSAPKTLQADSEEEKNAYQGYERLIEGCRAGNLATVEQVIEEGLTDLHAPWGKDAHTPLMIAIEQEHDDIACLLIERSRGNQLQMQDADGNTALMRAVVHGRDEVVQKLLRRGTPKQLQIMNHRGQSPLMLALDNHRIPITRYLLAAGADVPNDNGHTALMSAVAAGRPQWVTVLIKANVTINMKGPGNISPLSLAIHNGDVDMVNLLLIAGCNPDGPDDCAESPLMIAVGRGNEKIVRALLLQDASVNCANERGVTALHIAAKAGDVAIACQLLEHGADSAMQDGKGANALHVAARHGQVGVARLLLNHHAPIESTDKRGRTPLHHAARFGGDACCKLFLDAGANIDALDNKGESVLSMAKMAEDPATLAVVKHHYKVHRREEPGCTVS